MEENSGQEFWITCLFRWFSLYLSSDIQSFFFDVCLSTICRSHICQVFLHGICTVLKQNAPKHNKNIRNVYRLKVYFLMKYIKKKHWKSFDNQCLYFVGVAGPYSREEGYINDWFSITILKEIQGISPVFLSVERYVIY